VETITLQLTAIAHGGAALGRHEGRVIFLPYALPRETARVEITEDKGLLAASGGDGTVRIYVLPIEDLMALARSRLTRSLTDQECQQYLHVGRCPPALGEQE
jgi:hypothetical protein